MRATTAAVLTLCLIPGSAALAEQVNQAKVYRFPDPPAGFSPATASNDALVAHGLPARPQRRADGTSSNPALDHALAKARFFRAPMVMRVSHRHGPARHLLAQHTGFLSNNWAGEALQTDAGSYGGSSYAEVLGQWVVSSAQQAQGSCTGTDYSATWIGVDGLSNSTDVMQAGTEADAACTNGVNAPDYYAWFEWYPGDTYEISNFPIKPGGSVFVVVQANNSTNAEATFVNLQTGAYTTVGFSAPGSTSLVGDSAEWVVERPSPDSTKNPGTLADFGEIPMESEIGYQVDQIGTSAFNVPGAPPAGQTGYTITMQTQSGTDLAVTTQESISAQLVQVAGPTE